MADAALTQLQTALTEGRLEDAVAWGQKAVGAAPRYLRAIRGLLQALERAGRDDEAARVLHDVPPDIGGSVTDIVEMAKLCLREGVPDTALEMLRCALEADPERARVAELLVAMYYAQDDPAAVVAVSEPFRTRGQATPTLLRYLAAAYERLDSLEAAADCAALYAQAAPLDPSAHYHIGTLEHRLGRPREALERYHLAIQLSHGDSDLEVSAAEGIRALDAMQIRQIAGLAASDPTFRVALGRDPYGALEQRGFSLSEEGMGVLAGLNLHAIGRSGPGSQGYGHH